MEKQFYICFILILGGVFVDAISKENLYPFGRDHEDNRMNIGDDISTDEIPLRLPIMYYDDEHRGVYVSIKLFETKHCEIRLAKFSRENYLTVTLKRFYFLNIYE